MKKLYCILFVLVHTMVCAQVGERLIKYEFYNFRSLNSVLKDLSQKYGFVLLYNEDALMGIKVSQEFDEVSIEEGLRQMIIQNKLDLKFYRNKDDVIVIVPRTQKINAGELKTVIVFTENPTRFHFRLSGKVTDQVSGESLPFASVNVEGTSLSTTTNVDGYFTLLDVPSDTASLMVRYIGYLPQKVQLSPKSNISRFLVELVFSNDLEEVTVQAEKTEVLKANEVVGMIKMTPRNMAKLPNVGERDPFRAFQLMPGVSASNESSSGLYVRGGTPDQTLVLYDGFTVYHVEHLFGFFSAFNYNAIKDIQLYRGGFDAKFGGRLSAVAEITSKDGNNKQFNAGADIGLLSANAFIETPIGSKATFLIAGRKSWKSPLYKKIFGKFTNTNDPNASGGGITSVGMGSAFQNNATAASYFYDLNSKLTFRPTTKDIISLSLFNGTDNMDNSSKESSDDFFGGASQNFSFNTKTNDVSEWGNTGTSLKWSRRWNDTFYSNALVSYSHYYSDRENSNETSYTQNGKTEGFKYGSNESNNVYDQTAKIDFEWKASSSHKVEFGVQHANNRVAYKYSENDTTIILNRNDKGTISTAYLQDKWQIGKLQLTPGIRLNHFGITKRFYVEPRLSFAYQLSGRIKFKGSAGVYNQFIKQVNREDILRGNRNFWILSNDGTLPVTQSIHTILGGSYETKGYLFDVEFYQKKNTGVSEYTLRFVPKIDEGIRPTESFFNGTETIRGVDVLVQRKFGDLTGWLGYTLAEAKRNIAAFSDKPYYSDQDVRHQLKAVAMYHTGKWDLSAAWIYATGRPYTSVLGTYDFKLLDGTRKTFTNPSDKNANRFPDYHRLDVSATCSITQNFSFALSVFNLYNRQNTWYKRFQTTYTYDGKEILQITDIRYLGLVPSVMLSWKIR